MTTVPLVLNAKFKKDTSSGKFGNYALESGNQRWETDLELTVTLLNNSWKMMDGIQEKCTTLKGIEIQWNCYLQPEKKQLKYLWNITRNAYLEYLIPTGYSEGNRCKGKHQRT